MEQQNTQKRYIYICYCKSKGENGKLTLYLKGRKFGS